MTESLDQMLLLGAAVVLIGVLAVRVSTRLGLPGLLLYLGLGVLLGESGLGIQFDDAAVARDLGVVALLIILAEGGLTTRWSDIRPVLGVSLMLATVGVAVSVTVVGVVVHLFMDVGLQTSLLIGGVIASTDAAAVFSVLRRLRLRPGVRATLEGESGLNDPLAIVIVVLVVSGELSRHTWLYDVGLVIFELVVGGAIGLAFGFVGRWLLSRIALPAVGLYPLAVLAIVIAAFSTAQLAHASGFLAVYVCALVLASSRMLPHRRSVLGFTEGLAWLAQIGLFVLLGLLASPPRLTSAIPLALAAGLGLLLGRPLTVLVSATPFRVPAKEQAFLMAAGLRGAVPIVLASIALAEGTLDATQVFDATFLLVVVLTAIQAPPLPWLAARLGVGGDLEAGELEVDSAPLDEMNAALLEIAVPEDSRLIGLYVDPDLRLPKGASVNLVVRDGTAMVPNVQTRIRAGDRLLVVSTAEARSEAERRLRAVSRRGPVAGWFGEGGD